MNSIILRRKFNKFINGVKKLPQGKHHLDFAVAILTIPVLLSVIILNYSNLKKAEAPTTTQNEKPYIIVPTENKDADPTPTSSTCKKEIGPLQIPSPKEGQIVSDNPVCVTINYPDSSYCAVVWSYRINGGAWSDYNSGNPCIYNLPNGNIKFDLRIQSTVTQTEENISRNFIYKNSNPSATSSAQTQ